VRRVLSGLIYVLGGLVGLLAFAYPFLSQASADGSLGLARGQGAALVTAVLVGLSIVALMIETQGEALGAKTVAMLGVLVAAGSVLRFLEVAFPLPGGFSPVFVPILLGGYVFGARFGFLLGVFTLLTSALVTGGVGPWLPYQMIAAGWIGLAVGWLPHIGTNGRAGRAIEVVVLALFGALSGLAYGAIVNLYFWPYVTGAGGAAWSADLGVAEAVRRYASFYVLTSLAWDLIRAAGNGALLAFLGGPTLRALDRFRRRFHFKERSADA